jgi:threonine dehydrogenase-like Zn-dependent dehydrogenase
VKAVVFAAPIPTYLLTKAAGVLSPGLFLGPHACTRLTEVADPVLPGDRWVRIRTRLGGVCGSDLAVVTLAASPATSPLSSFPFVLGHENVGDVVETGVAVRSVTVGERVVANPLLSCVPRGIDPPCVPCAAGMAPRCEHFTDGAVAPGMLIGTTRGLGGSWGESFVAHESQVVRVPDGVSDESAVMVEPFACAVHAIRSDPPAAAERTLVIGAGTIGLVTLAALRALSPGTHVTVLARHAFQEAAARTLGASEVVRPHGSPIPALAKAGGTRLLQPILGPPIGVGGFDRSYVCVAGTDGVANAMRFTRAGGVVTLLGNVTTLPGLDWTPVWLKELTIRGSLTYGRHPGAGTDAFHEALDLIASGRAPVGSLVTHVFPLAEVGKALAAASGKKGSGSIKVALRP